MDRLISLGPGTARIPERLLLAQARGHSLLLTGAGVSRPSKLPDFRALVLAVYKRLDASTYSVLQIVESDPTVETDASKLRSLVGSLNRLQQAEIFRFVRKDYDVVLGMLERRIDSEHPVTGRVRSAISDTLRYVDSPGGGKVAPKPSPIHKALVRLANRGGTLAIATTNFDLLLERAVRQSGERADSFEIGEIPWPRRSKSFSGIFHIHGKIGNKNAIPSNMVVTDKDFGEYYLRRRIVPDFIYDSARLFHLVLVGYSANDAPMRYLLNAVAADSTRFDDIKERFAFVGMDTPFDEVQLEDWQARGIVPIPYDSRNNHEQLTSTLVAWSKLTGIYEDRGALTKFVRTKLSRSPSKTPEEHQEYIAHVFRRGAPVERSALIDAVNSERLDGEWIRRFLEIGKEDPD